MQLLSIMTSNTTMDNHSRGYILFWHFELKIHIKTLGQAVKDCGCDWTSSEETVLSHVVVRHPASLGLGPTDLWRCNTDIDIGGRNPERHHSVL